MPSKIAILALTMQNNGQHAFIFIGRSGCGKGTQAKLLIDAIKERDHARSVVYVETGKEFREFMKGETYTQKRIRQISGEGGLAPEFLAIYLWVSTIVREYTEGSHMVLDGMPRKLDEANIADSMLDMYGFNGADICYINVSREWAKMRMMERKRADDTEEKIDRRLDWFESDVWPVIQYFRNDPKYRVHDIHGERPMEEVHADLLSRIELP